MSVIPQRALRNDISAVLRRAEAGESFTITVDGRAVAALVPLVAERGFAAPDRLARVLVDEGVGDGWLGELAEMRARVLMNGPASPNG